MAIGQNLDGDRRIGVASVIHPAPDVIAAGSIKMPFIIATGTGAGQTSGNGFSGVDNGNGESRFFNKQAVDVGGCMAS
ncbi:hypothetical protein GCM10027347_07490 [Larkinella harenae]